MKRIHIIVSGEVQNVGYRWHAKQEAEALGLTGHACNLDSGTVEIEVQGEESAVETFVKVIEIGPRLAKVDRVTERQIEINTTEIGFEVL
ncbi:MAG: acylphosphatase [Candidatus Kapaibacterium sp.]|jgi:acylphosphatase